MARPPQELISLCLIFLTLSSKAHLCLSTRYPINLTSQSTATQLQSTPEDVHDIIARYGLPKGIIPNNVDSYTLADDGAFEINLQHSCYVQFDQLVYYDKLVKGKLKYGSVSDVHGIQAKKLFLWVSVTGMEADFESGMVEFHVGALSEKLPAEQFQTVPTCKNKACGGEKVETMTQSS